MPVRPSADAVEPLMRAVDRAVWVRYDQPHRLLFVGRMEPQPHIASYDVVTGEPHDAPWPIGVEIVAMLGPLAFDHAIAERIAQGF